MQHERVEWFEDWFNSSYYSILYHHRNHQEAQIFIEKLLEYLHPSKKSKMLDIACGQGRHSVQLALHHFDVTGIDLSASSIQQAKKRESPNLRFFVHDMRFPLGINYFDYAFNFFTSFGYFSTERDHFRAARSFAQNLKKGGLLVMDYLNTEAVKSNLIAEETQAFGQYKFHINRRVENNRFIKTIRSENGVRSDFEFTETVAAFSLEDFQKMFGRAGLMLTDTLGNYSLQPYDPMESPRMIMIFQKM